MIRRIFPSVGMLETHCFVEPSMKVDLTLT